MIQSSAQAILVLQDQHLPENQRTDAVHFLATDASAESIAALVAALSDADYGVRWAAGSALALLGEPAMPAVLGALLQPHVDKTLRDGVRHVLTDNRSPNVRQLSVPLVKALKGPEADIAAMQEAAKLLRSFH
jgi:HEAT repeat protein